MELHILGTRGIPANHGGFETFAENLSVYMAARGHDVTVYCQLDPGELPFEDVWNGVHRVGLPAKNSPIGTIHFDLRGALIASSHRGATVLTLGYNTAIFSLIYRLRGVRHLMNMDGIEWKRKKWNLAQRAWLWFNEWCGAHFTSHLIADHPNIKLRLQTKVRNDKISVIPYGAYGVLRADEEIVRKFGMEPGRYCLIVARPEPENSILEILKAYLEQPRPYRLVILGRYKPDTSAYQTEILDLASHPDVVMLGSIHDAEIVQALRYHAMAYVHGHQVGGTNPSLVESMGAGNAIIAHDNPFNRWVAGPGARYFGCIEELSAHFTALPDALVALKAMQSASKMRHAETFTQDAILGAYERLLMGSAMRETRWEIPETRLKKKLDSIDRYASSLPCPGYFSQHITDLLQNDATAHKSQQPCGRCGSLVDAKNQNGYWMPSMH